jgi:hypothetical protein
VTDDAPLRDELGTAIEARQELGEEMEPAVIDAFVERIERRLADRDDRRERALKRKRDHQKDMILGSMAISIPLFVVAVLIALVLIAIVSTRGD